MADPDYSVWKYPLEMRRVQSVSMPRGSRPLHVAVQDGVVTVWAWVVPSAPLVERRIALVGTGLSAPSPGSSAYWGTATHDGDVWHVFGDDPL